MIVRINVGLANAYKNNINGYHIVDIIKTGTNGAVNVLDWRVLDSKGGNWEPEPVLWTEIEIAPCNQVSTSSKVERFKNVLESLCVVLNEDAIAVAIVSPSCGDGTVIFNPHYTGERYEFNLDYFTE